MNKLAIVATLFLVLFAGVTALNSCVKQDGGWGPYLEWSPCNTTCGEGGYKRRHRYCNKPIPANKGAHCEGDSYEDEPCTNGACPPSGVPVWENIGGCSKPCGNGKIKQKKVCRAPTTYAATAECYYNDCSNTGETRMFDCNKHKCDTEPRQGCNDCLHSAKVEAKRIHREGTFVGHACRVDVSHCSGLSNGIRGMYPANDWFFLHCSPDGPWCKPCATTGLVYNPSCGQCEATRDGDCTGPQAWRNNDGSHKRDAAAANSVLNDDDMW